MKTRKGVATATLVATALMMMSACSFGTPKPQTVAPPAQAPTSQAQPQPGPSQSQPEPEPAPTGMEMPSPDSTDGVPSPPQGGSPPPGQPEQPTGPSEPVTTVVPEPTVGPAEPTFAPAPGSTEDPGPNTGGPAETLPDQMTVNGTGGTPDAAAATQYITAVIQNADQVWSTWMTQQGYQEPYVAYELIQPGAVYEAPKECSVPQADGTESNLISSDYPNAFYCHALTPTGGTNKGVLILPVESMMKMWSGDILGDQAKRVGDFAAASVVAHEFGHHIVWELGEQMQLENPQGKNKELIADCFSGVWTTALYTQGGLEEGDIDEALSALEAVGDDGTGPDPHGTPEERTNAFRVGIYGLQADARGGVPGNCINNYWAGFTGPR